MPEIICTFPWTEGWDDGADSVPEAANGSFGGFAQKGFELAEGRLDRVEVGRIARQVTQRGAGGRDRFAHAGDLMGFEIVDDHDVTALEGGNQALFEISEKACAGHRSIDHGAARPRM